MKIPIRLSRFVLGIAFVACAVAQEPTCSDVAYGPAVRQRLDFWQAQSSQRTPLVVYIHPGGFLQGDKSDIRGDAMLKECLAAGISFAAINYRFLSEATLPEILRDCARAIQFIRSRSTEWHVDPSRVACYGKSAGAGVSLWLAFHRDLADSSSVDPILRESTRLTCAGSISGQFSYDLLRWSEIWPDELIRRHAAQYLSPQFYGLSDDRSLRQPDGQRIREDCDMLGLIAKDAPPIYLVAKRPGGDVTDPNHFLHHPIHSKLIYDRCRELAVPVVAEIPAFSVTPTDADPGTLQDFLILQLRANEKGANPKS